MASLDENPILDLGKSPIPGPAPCGQDVAEDEEYLFVLSELGKMDRIEAAAEPDWYQMGENGQNILRNKSKDIEIASVLGFALFKRHSYAGLAASLGLLTQMVTNFWDGMFPDRPRRRKSRVESLADRFTDGKWFSENPPKSNDFDAIDLCVARTEELRAALLAKMPDDPPDFTKFVRGLKELALRRPKSGADAAAAGSAPAGGGGAPGFVGEAVADASGAMNAILAAGTFLRKADPTDPIPYAIARILKWSKISLPASDEGRNQIPPPESSTVEALTHQFNNSLWEHLLKNAEAAFRANDPLWLDLQRYACAAMTGLGPTYDKARQAVMGVTAALVSRLGPGLYDLKFRGGAPLCNGQTRMWIESEVAPAQSGGGGKSMSNGRLAEAADKARKLAGAGQLKEALKELQDGLSTCTQQRDRFLWRFRLAQLCLDAQRLQLAAPLLEECQQEIRRFHIGEWEPTLAVEVAQALYRCRKTLTAMDKQPPLEALQGVRESFAWLCQLDPLAALAAEPPAN